MKAVSLKARTLLTTQRRRFNALPNLRYFVGACATESYRPKWFTETEQYLSGKESRRLLSKIAAAQDEYFISVLDLFAIAFSQKDVSRRKRTLHVIDRGIEDAIRTMKETGVGPRPIPLEVLRVVL